MLLSFSASTAQRAAMAAMNTEKDNLIVLYLFLRCRFGFGYLEGDNEGQRSTTTDIIGKIWGRNDAEMM